MTAPNGRTLRKRCVKVNEFWWFVSFVISVTGFMIAGAVSFLGGEDMFYVALKSIGAFVILWIAQSFLRGLLAVAGSAVEPGQLPEKE